MVQRIQSLFLLIACISFFIIVFHPVTRMTLSDGSTAYMTSFGVRVDEEDSHLLYFTFPIAILASICGLLSLLAIFLYHKRSLQMRLCGYAIILTFVLIAVILIYYFIVKNRVYEQTNSVINSTLLYPVIFPFVNIILLFQSFRAIHRDDLLIKSYDRLR